MSKHKSIGPKNKPCRECGKHVTCVWRNKQIIRQCDECGYEEKE